MIGSAKTTASWGYGSRMLCVACDEHHNPKGYCPVDGYPAREDRWHVVTAFDADEWRTEQTVASEPTYDRALGVALHYASWDAYERVLMLRIDGTTGRHDGPARVFIKDGHHRSYR